MKTTASIIIAGLVLLFAGGAGAANSDQLLLDGTLIPKFVDPLPEGVPDGTPGGITVVNATASPLLGLPSTPNYNIHIMEFQSQILPSTGVPDPANPGVILYRPTPPRGFGAT